MDVRQDNATRSRLIVARGVSITTGLFFAYSKARKSENLYCQKRQQTVLGMWLFLSVPNTSLAALRAAFASCATLQAARAHYRQRAVDL